MTIRNLDDIADQIEALRWVKQQKAMLKAVESAARQVIDAAMDGADLGAVDGEPVIKYTHYKAAKLNQKALKEAHPDLVAEFTELNEITRLDIDPEITESE